MQTLLYARTQLRCVHDFGMQHVGLDKRHKRHSVDLWRSIRVHGQPRGDTDASSLPRAPEEAAIAANGRARRPSSPLARHDIYQIIHSA